MKISLVYAALSLAFLYSCGSAAPAKAKIRVGKATFSRYSGHEGDRAISFLVQINAAPQDLEVQSFWVNDRLLDFETLRDSSSILVKALRSYPTSGKGFDPLPPGEAPQILYFQKNFSAKLVLKKDIETDTLFIKDFTEVEWDGR